MSEAGDAAYGIDGAFDTRASEDEAAAFESDWLALTRTAEAMPHRLVTGFAEEAIRRLSIRPTGGDHAHPLPPAEELETLCACLVAGDQARAEGIIAAALADGASMPDIYLNYLGAAARNLGELWLEDEMSFVDVTVGTGTIFRLMRGMKRGLPPSPRAQDISVIFAAVPGENHTLGIRMAADLFRDDGWEIALKVGLDQEQLVSEIEQARRAIVGLSIGGRHSLDALSRLVVALHIRCPHAALLVAGQNIEDIRPQLSLLGLDGIAVNLEEAKEKVAFLWDREATRHGGRRAGLRRCP